MSSRRIALLLAASLVVAACSNDDDAEHNTTSPSTIDEIVDIRDQPGAEVAAGALDDVGELTCESGGGGWTASADVSNSTDGVVSYRIYVSFLDTDGETLGVTQVDVDAVASGASEDWEASLEVSSEDLDCVLRVERFEG